MRRVVTAVIAATSLFALGGVAQAQPPQDPATPPEFAPPAPAPVVDTDSAAAFTERYVARTAQRVLRERSRRRVRVLDVNAACLEHPVVANRFGCIFTLRALIIQRRRGWEGYPAKSGPPKHRRVRIRRIGCLGALSVTGGPSVTPTAQLRFVECARVPRGDYTAPEPEPVA